MKARQWLRGRVAGRLLGPPPVLVVHDLRTGTRSRAEDEAQALAGRAAAAHDRARAAEGRARTAEARARDAEHELRVQRAIAGQYSHDLKTGLAVIAGWASSLEHAWDRFSDEQRHDGVASIRRNAEALLAQARQMADDSGPPLPALDGTTIDITSGDITSGDITSGDSTRGVDCVDLTATD